MIVTNLQKKDDNFVIATYCEDQRDSEIMSSISRVLFSQRAKSQVTTRKRSAVPKVLTGLKLWPRK